MERTQFSLSQVFDRKVGVVLVTICALVGILAMSQGLERSQDLKRFAVEIPDLETWSKLAASPESATVARTEVVKFVRRVSGDRSLRFMNTRRYSGHYDFVCSLDRRYAERDNSNFNRRQYQSENRNFEMGSIVRYKDSNLWTLELAACDNLSGERIAQLYEALKKVLWIGDRLQFRPRSPRHSDHIATVAQQVPVVSTDQVFRGVQYQPLTLGVAYGYLRLVSGTLSPSSVRPNQILVLGELPLEVPLCTGVISEPLQAPLGHVAILCENRRTPNMGLKEALSHEQLLALDGSLVKLEVMAQEFKVSAASLEEARIHWKRQRPLRPKVPQFNRRTKELIAVKVLRKRDASYAGAKAAQLGVVGRVHGVRTPGGFVVPMSHYFTHLENSLALAGGIPEETDAGFGESLERRTEWLSEVRKKIESHSVEPELLARVRQRMVSSHPQSRWILRSSTNAEDLVGFSGAGLYRSVRLGPDASEKELAEAMAQVWSSVWLQGAFEERRWYRIEHTSVGMAILVQPFIDNVIATGVAITANPFFENRPGVYINAQALGGSVTCAEGDEIPEQLLVYDFLDEPEIEIVSRSSRKDGKPLLKEETIHTLAKLLGNIHKRLVPSYGARGNAVDVEFLVDDNRQIVILQARPYKVTYAWGQR